MKDSPYRSLGFACAVGVGVGIIVSSRVLRMAFASAASVALLEFGRNYLLHEVDAMEGHSGRTVTT